MVAAVKRRRSTTVTNDSAAQSGINKIAAFKHSPSDNQNIYNASN